MVMCFTLSMSACLVHIQLFPFDCFPLTSTKMRDTDIDYQTGIYISKSIFFSLSPRVATDHGPLLFVFLFNLPLVLCSFSSTSSLLVHFFPIHVHVSLLFFWVTVKNFRGREGEGAHTLARQLSNRQREGNCWPKSD